MCAHVSVHMYDGQVGLLCTSGGRQPDIEGWSPAGEVTHGSEGLAAPALPELPHLPRS